MWENRFEKCDASSHLFTLLSLAVISFSLFAFLNVRSRFFFPFWISIRSRAKVFFCTIEHRKTSFNALNLHLPFVHVTIPFISVLVEFISEKRNSKIWIVLRGKSKKARNFRISSLQINSDFVVYLILKSVPKQNSCWRKM